MKFFPKSALLTCAIAVPFPFMALAAEPLQVGLTYLVGGLDPANGSAGWALTSHGVGENLFTVDKDGRLVPQLAASAERTGNLTWTVTLAPERFFANGEPVTAAALKEGFDNTFAKNPAASSTGGKLAFAALDALTLEVTTEKPVPRLAALFAEWPLVAYTLADDGAAVFTGPYAIADLKVDQQADLVPNMHFAGAEARSPITLRKFGDGQTMALALEAGELDLAFGLPAESLSRLRATPELTVKSFPVGYQYFGFLNTGRPALADVKVRQAVDLTLDRAELVAAIEAGLPATGAYAPYFPFAAKKPRPTDLVRAEALLDEAGWTKGGDGMRVKDGAPLRLLAVTYPQRPDLVTMLPVVKAALARVGIALDTQVSENINDVAAGGDFDMLLFAQHTAPAGDPAFFLNSMLTSDGPLNHARYASDAFDGIVAGFGKEAGEKERNAIALAAQAQLFEDVPVTFLVSPEWHVGVSERLSGYEPWGSDYYVIRADMGEAN